MLQRFVARPNDSGEYDVVEVIGTDRMPWQTFEHQAEAEVEAERMTRIVRERMVERLMQRALPIASAAADAGDLRMMRALTYLNIAAQGVVRWPARDSNGKLMILTPRRTAIFADADSCTCGRSDCWHRKASAAYDLLEQL